MRGRTAVRRTALLAAASLALGLAPSVASAVTGDPSDLGEACDGAPSAKNEFNDYGTLDQREREVVDCLASGYKGDKNTSDFVLQGGADGNLHFDRTISRAQFAAILNRVADYLGIQSHTGDNANPTFADVPPGSFFFNEIEELFKRQLTTGKGNDTNDVDNDGDTQELIYDPNGDVSYAQVIAFVHRLLTDGAGYNLKRNQSHNESNLDCGAFQAEHDDLDDAGFLRRAYTPNNCKILSPRGLVFDLIAVALDYGVEEDKIENPFVEPPGSVTIDADKSSATTSEFVNVTVTVLDNRGNPVSGARVNVFAVNPDDAFTQDGAPKDPGYADVAGTGKYGTGSSPTTIDSGDNLTNSQGKTTVSVRAKQGGVDLAVYAMIGESGRSWTDVKDTEGAVTDSPVEITFNALPTDIVVESLTGTDTLKFGNADIQGDADSWGVVFTVVDSQGQPIKQEGISFTADLFRRVDPETNQSLEFRVNLTTDSSGRATWRPIAPSDPDQTEDTDDDANDTVEAYILNGDGTRRLESSQDLQLTWLDAPRSAAALATVSLVGGNAAKPDVMGASLSEKGGQQALFITVTNVYGDPAPLAPFQVSYGQAVPPEFTTDNNGTQTVFVNAPNNATARNYTVTVDANGDDFYGVGDVVATSPTGDQDVTIHWVQDPPTSLPGTIGDTGFNIAGITGTDSGAIYVYSTTGGRYKLLYDGNDVYFGGASTNECPTVVNPSGGESLGNSTNFSSAIKQDFSQNDIVRISNYSSGSGTTVCWVLDVNQDSSGPVLP